MTLLHKVFNLRMLSVLLLGLSSGLPLLLIGSTFKAWMTDEGVDLGVIGLFALVGLPYAFKFVWAPIFDRFSLPFMDRRRGWIFVFQILLALGFVAISSCSPSANPVLVACIAFLIAFCSASQDISIDAYRREVLATEELGLGSSFAVNGYRIGMLIAGAGGLSIAELWGWKETYLAMAAIMAACTLITVISPKVNPVEGIPTTLRESIIEPFIEFFRRKGALEILIFVLLFKIGDQIASEMFTPFYLKIGFTKIEVGLISKLYGFWATIIGGILGGLILLKIKLIKGLWIFGILQCISTFGFSILALTGNNIHVLTGVITFENLASGMGTAAYTAFMASLCNKRFTATQYALLSSFMGVPRVFFGSLSGFLAAALGWFYYFTFCALLAIPGLLMLLRAKKWQSSSE